MSVSYCLWTIEPSDYRAATLQSTDPLQRKSLCRCHSLSAH